MVLERVFKNNFRVILELVEIAKVAKLNPLSLHKKFPIQKVLGPFVWRFSNSKDKPGGSGRKMAVLQC